MTRRGRPAHPDILTPAEWVVLEGVREGLSNAEIADRLGVSVNTIRYHVSNMLTKVGVPDRQALAAWEGAPAVEVRRHHGLLALARIVGLAAALLVGAVLVWIALDRLSGTSAEVPASPPEATATVTPEEGFDPLARDVPFVSSGDLWARALMSPSTSTGPPEVDVTQAGDIVVGATVAYVEVAPGDYTAEPGGGPLVGGGGTDGLLAKYDGSGAHLWSRLLAGPGDEIVYDIFVTPEGAIVVTGEYGDGADLGRGAEDGDRRNAFIAQYDLDGRLQWVKTVGSDVRDRGIAVDRFSNGDIAWAGTVGLATDFGGVRVGEHQEIKGFIARLSPDGDVRWVTPTPSPSAITVDPDSDRVTFALYTDLDLDDPTNLPSYGIAALSGDGAPLWRTDFEIDGTIQIRDLASLADGSVVAIGDFNAPTDLGGGLLEPAGCCDQYAGERMPRDAFALRIGVDGEHLWSRHWGGYGDEFGYSVAVDREDNIIVGGTFSDVLDIAGLDRVQPPRVTDDPYSLFALTGGHLLWLSPNGEPFRLDTIGETGRVNVIGPIIVDSAATTGTEILVGGRFFESVTFGFGGRIANSEWLDYFIARVEAP